MKKIMSLFLIVCTFMSCIATNFVDSTYDTYNDENNVVINENVCYVYYANPTVEFLNTLHIVNGSYYYWSSNRYIPVVFPRWNSWSPNRYFYYDKGKWLWRDRVPTPYNRRMDTHNLDNRNRFHNRQPNFIIDSRRPPIKPITPNSRDGFINRNGNVKRNHATVERQQQRVIQPRFNGRK